MISALFLCLTVAISDADTIRCASGERVRIAAINARERDGTCNHEPCPQMRHETAKPIVERMILGKTLQCRPVGRSGRRVVADCWLGGRNVGCEIIRAGAATDWRSYRVRYRMRACR